MMEELNLIRKIVWSYVRTNPALDFDDLFSEACLAYLEVKPNYDPNKSKKSTYIYHIVRNRLNTLVGNERKRKANESLVDISKLEKMISEYENTPEQHLIAQERWEELMARLSPEALVIWRIINEKDVYLCIDKPKLCRGVLTNFLRESGWSWKSIENTFREIRETVST